MRKQYTNPFTHMAGSLGAKPFIHFVQAATTPAAPVAAARRNQQELFA